MNKQWKAQI